MKVLTLLTVIWTVRNAVSMPMRFDSVKFENQEDEGDEKKNVNPVQYLYEFGYIPVISFRGVGNKNAPASLLDENSPEVQNAVRDFQVGL